MADDEIDYVNAPGWQTVAGAPAQSDTSTRNPNFDFRTAEQRSEDIVRRQNIWRRSRRKLVESGPRLGIDIRRRAFGAASADIGWSVV